MLLHPSVASHGSTCPGAQVRSGAPYPGAPQHKELGVNGRRDCVPCAELWERSALAPSEGLPFPLANINHSRQCVWQEALVFVGFSFFFLLAPLRLALHRGVPRLWCSQPKKAEHLSALPSRGQVAGGETAMEFGKQKRSIPDSIAIHGVTVVTSVSYSSGAGLEKNRSRGVFKQQLSLVPHCPWHPVLHGALRTAPRPAAGHGGLCAPSARSWQGLWSAAGSAESSTVRSPMEQTYNLLWNCSWGWLLESHFTSFCSWVIAAGCSVTSSTCCTAAPFSITLQVLGCSALSPAGLGWEWGFGVKRKARFYCPWSACCSAPLCGVLGRCV